ncbi:hypothetical protein D3C72_1571700 [compost metagenome]
MARRTGGQRTAPRLQPARRLCCHRQRIQPPRQLPVQGNVGAHLGGTVPRPAHPRGGGRRQGPDGAAVPGPAVRQPLDSRAHVGGLRQVPELGGARGRRGPDAVEGLGLPHGNRFAGRDGLCVLAARGRQARVGSLCARQRARGIRRTIHPQDAGEAGDAGCRLRPPAGPGPRCPAAPGPG